MTEPVGPYCKHREPLGNCGACEWDDLVHGRSDLYAGPTFRFEGKAMWVNGKRVPPGPCAYLCGRLVEPNELCECCKTKWLPTSAKPAT